MGDKGPETDLQLEAEPRVAVVKAADEGAGVDRIVTAAVLLATIALILLSPLAG